MEVGAVCSASPLNSLTPINTAIFSFLNNAVFYKEKKKKKKRILSSISSHQAKDLSPTRQGVNESPSTVPLSRHKAKVSAGLRVGISKQPVDPHLLIAASNYHGTTSLCM